MPSLPPDALLLGWHASDPGPFGFDTRSTRPGSAEEPVLYQGEGHLLTVAPTRSGKGRGVVIPNLLRYAGPAVVFDPKGEIYRVTARRRREMGQRVVRIDPCQVIGPDSDTLNPFDVFDLVNADLETDAQTVAEWLAQGNRGTKEPFWDNQASALHGGVITHVATRAKEERNLDAVRKFLMNDDVVYNLAVLLDTAGKAMNRMAYDEIAAFLATTDVTRSGILSTAQAYLKPFVSERMAGVFRNSSFDLADVVRGEPLTIYLILPPDKLKSHKALLKMWVGTLLKALTSRRTLPARRTVLFLDEAAQLENFPYLETVMTLCAGYGAQCWTFWQDLSQLKACYPATWETILNNCDVLQTFGVRNRHMAAQWGEFLDHGPEGLLSLTPGRQVVRVHGRKEAACRRADYLADAPFAGLYDDNPMYGPTPDCGGPRLAE